MLYFNAFDKSAIHIRVSVFQPIYIQCYVELRTLQLHFHVLNPIRTLFSPNTHLLWIRNIRSKMCRCYFYAVLTVSKKSSLLRFFLSLFTFCNTLILKLIISLARWSNLRLNCLGHLWYVVPLSAWHAPESWLGGVGGGFFLCFPFGAKRSYNLILIL